MYSAIKYIYFYFIIRTEFTIVSGTVRIAQTDWLKHCVDILLILFPVYKTYNIAKEKLILYSNKISIINPEYLT